MSSLYKRATPSQAMVLRIVEGAVKNAADAHPSMKISPQHRRSIAKRAAGTLTAQWPDVLAAPRGSSESGGGLNAKRPRRRSSDFLEAAGREALTGSKRFPLRRLIAEIARPIRDLKLAGQMERAEAMIDVLKMIHRLRFPAESGAKGSERSDEGNPATDEPPLYISREEGNSSSRRCDEPIAGLAPRGERQP